MKDLKLSRRRFVASAAGGATALMMPSLSFASARPAITHGLQSGDVTSSSGMIWARADRPARMMVDWSTTESFDMTHAVQPLDVTAAVIFPASSI